MHSPSCAKLRFEKEDCIQRLTEIYLYKGKPLSKHKLNGKQATQYLLGEFGQVAPNSGFPCPPYAAGLGGHSSSSGDAVPADGLPLQPAEPSVEDFYFDTHFAAGRWYVRKIQMQGELAGEVLRTYCLPPISEHGQGCWELVECAGQVWATQADEHEELICADVVLADPVDETAIQASSLPPKQAARGTPLPGMVSVGGGVCS